MGYDVNPQYAWAAGLFEGEGCWFTRTRGGRTYANAALSMTDEDVVRRFGEVVGVGRIRFDPPRQANWKGCWTWSVTKREDFDALAEIVRPFLGERRLARLDEVLAARSPAKIRAQAEHGTMSRYNNQGCRCEPCRAANRAKRAA